MKTGERLPFGLLELDAAGVVIRYSPAAERDPEVPAKDVLGRNFFTEIAPVPQLGELRGRLLSFMERGGSVEKLSTVFSADGEAVKLQLLLAVTPNSSDTGGSRLAFVRLVPEADGSQRAE